MNVNNHSKVILKENEDFKLKNKTKKVKEKENKLSPEKIIHKNIHNNNSKVINSKSIKKIKDHKTKHVAFNTLEDKTNKGANLQRMNKVANLYEIKTSLLPEPIDITKASLSPIHKKPALNLVEGKTAKYTQFLNTAANDVQFLKSEMMVLKHKFNSKITMSKVKNTDFLIINFIKDHSKEIESIRKDIVKQFNVLKNIDIDFPLKHLKQIQNSYQTKPIDLTTPQEAEELKKMDKAFLKDSFNSIEKTVSNLSTAISIFNTFSHVESIKDVAHDLRETATIKNKIHARVKELKDNNKTLEEIKKDPVLYGLQKEIIHLENKSITADIEGPLRIENEICHFEQYNIDLHITNLLKNSKATKVITMENEIPETIDERIEDAYYRKSP